MGNRFGDITVVQHEEAGGVVEVDVMVSVALRRGEATDSELRSAAIGLAYATLEDELVMGGEHRKLGCWPRTS